jgi:hypothetical protein
MQALEARGRRDSRVAGRGRDPGGGGPKVHHADAARAIVRELKAVGGDLKALRLALTGRDRGPELWSVLAALPRDEALRRVDAVRERSQDSRC